MLTGNYKKPSVFRMDNDHSAPHSPDVQEALEGVNEGQG